MFELRCTVRKCSSILQPHSSNGLTCQRGHHFDRAKQGYWNLSQPQDRRSAKPGDSDDAVLARHRWLQRGHGAGLIDTLRPWVADSQGSTSVRTLDLGCGEGTFGAALFAGDPQGYCGIDLSKRAIKIAARNWPEGTWVLANADRTLPAADQTVDRVISLFGRRPVDEIARVLPPGGTCIVAVPGEEDLIELREQVQQSGHRRRRWEMVVDEMAAAGMRLVEQTTWQHRVELDRDAIRDALAMTYRGVRHSEQARTASLDQIEVTLAADLVRFERSSG